ncbi:NTP transferase domain-containing protein [Candidatus Saccharibacteria bacterium]|nr:NTP transferase domain-containing protein [Candidatus Saccharibacteria bacterium]
MTEHKKVRKAVIAAAGFGTRFLPQTKAMPKEMLPLIDKPIIQYIVEELVEAGIEDIVIVTGYHKRSIEDHFDYISADLRDNLKQGNKLELLEETKKISDLANFAYIRQKGPYGSATPILNAAHLIGDEPFIYTFADDLVPSSPNRFTQMIDLHEELQGAILPCIRVVEDEGYKRYGILAGEMIRSDVIKMSGVVEKPGKDNAPSDLASVGGYLLTPDVFPYIEAGIAKLEKDQEFYLTTFVLESMLKDGKDFFGCALKNSKYYDTGNKLEYLKTVVDFGLHHKELSEDFKTYLRSLLDNGVY